MTPHNQIKEALIQRLQDYKVFCSDVGASTSINDNIQVLLSDTIALLTAQETAEPAAWISFNVLTNTEIIQRKPITSMQAGVYKHTKLYTTPQPLPEQAQELSDEEILKIAKPWFDRHAHWNGDGENNLVKFARSLLRSKQ